MSIKYHNLVKKSIFCLSIGIFLFLPFLTQAKTPNDEHFHYQTAVWEQINALKAWDYTTGSKDVIVAVIDVGVDIWHNDLKENIWTNYYEIPNNGKDDDKNGFVDDVNGWNFIEDNGDVRTSVFDSSDDSGIINHGTGAAGIIGAKGNNEKGIAGLNWEVQLMPLRVVKNDGTGDLDTVARAINYAVENGASVINLSMAGNVFSSGMEESVKNAYENNVLVVAATGNSNEDLLAYPNYPVCHGTTSTDWVLGVSAVDENNKKAWFSNFGECADISALGVNVLSSVRYAPQFGYSSRYEDIFTGTSFSTPFVSGVGALIESINDKLTVKEVQDIILNTAKNIDNLNPNYVGELGTGILDAGEAIKKAVETVKKGEFEITEIIIKENLIYKHDLKEKKLVFVNKILGAELVDVFASDITNNKKQEIAILLKRGKYNYIKFLQEDGQKISEFSLDSLPVLDFKTKFDEKLGKPVAVVRFALKSGFKFVKYDLWGKVLSEVEYFENVNKWDILNDGELLILQTKISNLSAVRLDWEGEENLFWEVKNYYLVDFALGGFNHWGGEQMSVLVESFGKQKIYVVDTKFGSHRQLDIETKGESLIAVQADADKYKEIVVMAEENNFVVYDLDGSILKKGVLPENE